MDELYGLFKTHCNNRLLVFDPAPIFSSDRKSCINCEKKYNMFEPAKYMIEKRLLDEDTALNLSFKGGQCYACHQGSFVVSPKGDFYKCTVTLNDENAIVGNIRDGVDLNKYYFRWVNPNLPKKCNNCLFLPLCQGGVEQVN